MVGPTPPKATPMPQPPMLVLLSTQDPAAEEALSRAGHLPVPAPRLAEALAEDGPAGRLARHLAGQCDACVTAGAPPPGLAAVFRALRRPVYPSVHLVPRADPAPPPAPSLPGATALLGFGLRMLDR
jgi:hypothetical protein